jgi:hypothetical protein
MCRSCALTYALPLVTASLTLFFCPPPPTPLSLSQDMCKRSINREHVDKEAFLRLFPLPGMLGGEQWGRGAAGSSR